MKEDFTTHGLGRLGALLLGAGALCLLAGVVWQGVAMWRAHREQAQRASLEARVAEARAAVERLGPAAQGGQGLTQEARRFQDRVEELALPEEVRRGIAREAAWRLLQKAESVFAEAESYRREEPDHPHLPELLGELRALRTQAFPLLASGLPPPETPDAGRVRHTIFYAKGLLDAWIADVENDKQRQVETWLAAVAEMREALKEAPEDAWTIEDLEALGSTFRPTIGHAEVQGGGDKPGRSDPRKPEEAPPLPQRQGNAPAVPKGRM